MGSYFPSSLKCPCEITRSPFCRKGVKPKYPESVTSKPCRRKEQKKDMISFLTEKEWNLKFQNIVKL